MREPKPSVTPEHFTSNSFFGDVLVRSSVEAVELSEFSARLAIAEKLRALADFIQGTTGDPVSSAEIMVLMRRAR